MTISYKRTGLRLYWTACTSAGNKLAPNFSSIFWPSSTTLLCYPMQLSKTGCGAERIQLSMFLNQRKRERPTSPYRKMIYSSFVGATPRLHPESLVVLQWQLREARTGHHHFCSKSQHIFSKEGPLQHARPLNLSRRQDLRHRERFVLATTNVYQLARRVSWYSFVTTMSRMSTGGAHAAHRCRYVPRSVLSSERYLLTKTEHVQTFVRACIQSLATVRGEQM